MFLLSVQIIELYIKKYAEQIRHNLDKVYPDRWFQPFYRRDFEYNADYEQYLKAMWETVFLCFPVVTTTLHAFDRKKFPMIQEMFDLLLIDEAGQALIHTAVGPLFRFRRAVVVGDIFQLEPIRNTVESSIIDGIELPIQIKENIEIEQNSVQHAADRGSEIFDELAQQKVGIVLQEHRRCESAIVQFSNQYVYDKCLKIVKQDEKKDFLGYNFCMVDVRGVKSRGNENISEVEVCRKIVEMLVQIYGKGCKKKIGIITPYKNQARLLKEKMPDIDSGTVHTFQGQEKDVILMSVVVDNTKRNSGAYFVGDKPNFLNVAFTRAKKQLILVGNYEACWEAQNYLSKAMKCLRKYGRLYSLYEPEIMEREQIEEQYLKQFWSIISECHGEKTDYQRVLNKYIKNGIIAGANMHHSFLKEILSGLPKSVKIISPWITASVVDQEFLHYVRKLKEQSKMVKICFGYHKTNYTLDELEKIVNTDCFGNQREDNKTAILELRNVLGEDLLYMPPLHSKILIIDDEFMIVTSYNWLSNSGKAREPRDEVGCLIFDKSAIGFVNERYGVNGKAEESKNVLKH